MRPETKCCVTDCVSIRPVRDDGWIVVGVGINAVYLCPAHANLDSAIRAAWDAMMVMDAQHTGVKA